jgi:hypothetical protein
MAKAGYTVTTGGEVSLSAATAKTVLNVIAPATFGIDLRSVEIAFDGVTASNEPVLVEICSSTQATAGTNSAATPVQVYGRAITTGFTAAKNYSAEPTVLTVIDEFSLSPNGGLVIRDWPLGEGFDQDVSKGLAIRITAPQTVSVRATMKFERC